MYYSEIYMYKNPGDDKFSLYEVNLFTKKK